MRLSPILAALALGTLAPAAMAQTARLTVTVTGIETLSGQMMVAVFDAAGYDSEKPVATNTVKVTNSEASVVFADLAPGRYGVKLYQDVNGDGKMNANAFGAPTEPYAFSNNAKGRFGPAKWSDAAFDLGASGAVQTIRLN